MSDPAEKYRDKVSPEHRMAMEAIGFMRQILGQHRGQFETLLEAEQRSHSMGMILDPTLYRDMIYSKSFAQQIRLVKAAVAFLNEVDAVANEIESAETAKALDVVERDFPLSSNPR
jgi:hypothetical protein